MLLQRGGKQTYFGPCRDAVRYFQRSERGAGQNEAQIVNPADYLLDVTKTGVDVPDEELDNVSDLDVLSKRWTGSEEYRAVKAELVRLGAPVSPSRTTKLDRQQRRTVAPAASVWRQCVLLTQRVSRHYFRDASFSYTKFFTSSIIPLIIGLSFFLVGREHTIVSFQNRMFSVFLLLFVPVVWMNAIIFKVHSLRGLWEARERPSRIYGRTAFVTSLLVSEIPYSVLCAATYFILWYFLSEPAGLPTPTWAVPDLLRSSTVGFPFKLSTMSFAFLLIQIFFFFQVRGRRFTTIPFRTDADSPLFARIVDLGPLDRLPLPIARHNRQPLALLPRRDGSVQWLLDIVHPDAPILPMAVPRLALPALRSRHARRPQIGRAHV